MEHIERVQRELKYKGTILSMYADTIKVPNGNTAVWDFIGHQGAAAVVPVTDDGKILRVKQYRNSGRPLYTGNSGGRIKQQGRTDD